MVQSIELMSKTLPRSTQPYKMSRNFPHFMVPEFTVPCSQRSSLELPQARRIQYTYLRASKLHDL